MKRKLVALAASISIVAGTFHSAPASAQPTETPAESSSSSSAGGEGSSEDTVITLAAVAALIGALGGGGMWAVQQGLIANPLPGIIPGPPVHSPAPAPEPRRGVCSIEAFNGALWEWRDSYRTAIEYCDGRFAWVSQTQTDWRVAFEFDGQRWQVLQPAGTTKTGMTQGCYNGIELRNKGASNNFVSRLPICTPDEIGYSPW